MLDVFKNAIGYETDVYSTKELVSEYDIREYIYYPNGSETDEEKASVEKEFNETLKPGDGIVVRYKNKSSGHAMLYVGNGEIIHSSGSSYNYDEQYETYEPSIRYMQVKDLFTPDTRRYVFSELSQIAIIRPLNDDSVILPKAQTFVLEI